MELQNIACAVIPLLVFAGLIIIGIGLINSYNNKEKWCEKCNTWQRMSRMSGQITGWNCPNCKWINQEKYGSCPTCGWYGRYENGTISRRGPFRKIDRTPVTPFWGVQEEYWAYEEKIMCPKHDIFTAYIPASANQTSYQEQYDDYDDRYDEDAFYDREYENRNFN
jgi:hypothetical protein